MRNELAPDRVCEEDRLLASVAGAGTVHEVCFSPDGTAVAFIASSSGRYLVQDARATRSTYDLADNLVVGPMGETSAHCAQQGEKRMIVKNSRPGPLFYWVNAPVLGVDGQTVAYCAMSPIVRGARHRPGGTFIVVGERLLGPFDDAGNHLFNHVNGDLIASVRHRGSDFVIIGEGHGPSFERVLYPTVQPVDGSTWYLALRSGSWVIVRNHVVVDAANIGGEIPVGPFFSPDGCHVFYWRCDGSHWSAVVDGATVGTVERPLSWARSLAIGRSGQVAYAGHSDGGVFVVAAGEKQGPFDAVGPLVFSGDGARLAYVARRGDRGLLLLDGRTVGRFDPLLPDEGLYADYLEDWPSFSADGASLACRVGAGGMKSVMLNGESGPRFVSISGAPAFSPTTGSLVYGCAEPCGEYVVINHARSERYERVWSTSSDPEHSTILWQPTFAANGTKVAFGARLGDELHWRLLSC